MAADLKSLSRSVLDNHYFQKLLSHGEASCTCDQNHHKVRNRNSPHKIHISMLKTHMTLLSLTN